VALQGLRDVIVDLQSKILDAAIEAHVKRFIPTDYSIDFTHVKRNENRNFELRKEFHAYVDSKASQIRCTSIFNGAFLDMIGDKMPIVDLKKKTINFFGDPDQVEYYTSYADTARFTAAASLDAHAPRYLYCAAASVSPNDLMRIVSEATGEPYKLNRIGSLTMLNGIIAVTRNSRAIMCTIGAAALYAFSRSDQRVVDADTMPYVVGAAGVLGVLGAAGLLLPYRVPIPFVRATEKELMPAWQGAQYFENMCNGRFGMPHLDNKRYDIAGSWHWTGIAEHVKRKVSRDGKDNNKSNHEKSISEDKKTK